MAPGGAYEYHGSGSDVVEYSTEINSVFVQADLVPDDYWALSFGCVYTTSKGSYEAVMLELPDEVVDHADYDFSAVHTYSDLDFKQLEVTGRADREVSENVSLYLGVSYFDLQDGEPYVYGDQDGNVLFTQAGFKTRF